MGNISAEDPLDHIGSIQAVHAISSKGSLLLLQNLHIPRVIDFRSQIKSVVDFCHKTIPFVELLLDNVNKLRMVFPLHFLALSMEIKPGVVEITVLKLLVEASELVSDPLLRSFFVDKVDKVLLTV